MGELPPGQTIEPLSRPLDTEDPDPQEAPEESKPKAKRKGVRFATTGEGEVIPEKLPFERSANNRGKAQEALACLLAGNQRFVGGSLERCKAGREIIDEIATDIPRPGTVILACSDSRVPPEIVMDQGLGDCHVVRVAGNVVNDFVMGSILFAVQHLGCRLVMVLGHSRCSVVASGVQTWARRKTLQTESTDVRSLAEGVQETLGLNPAQRLQSQTARNLNVQRPAVTSERAVSPFSAEAAQKLDRQAHAKAKRQSALSRFCGCCPGVHRTEDGGAETSGTSAPMQTQAHSESRKGPGGERSVVRSSMTRSSINPLSALIGAITGVVEAVANSGQHDAGLKSIVRKENDTDRSQDGENDYEDLKKGLQKQDSLEFTRARLAKQKAERKIDDLRQLAARTDVDSVIDENTKVSAATILRGLVKNMDSNIVLDMEVVAAKYLIDTGEVKLLSRNWYANHTYYNSND